MKTRNIIIVCSALLALSFVIAACGKVGDPQPRQTSRSFVWQKVRVTPVNDCLDVKAAMSGVYTNLHSVRLEIDGINGPEDCPACPFTPTENYVLDDLKNTFNSSTGDLHFSYCPREKAAMYRYRLIGLNIFDTSRHAISPEGFVTMPSDKKAQSQDNKQVQQSTDAANAK